MIRLSDCITTAVLFLIALFSGSSLAQGPKPEPYQPSWNSLRTYPVPQWLRDGKFGIYTHWGVYSVPAFGPNGTWYAHNIYRDPNSTEGKHHQATYGPLEKFGYKDFIPMFTGEKFNAEEWADLFERSGARFAGPVAEHHDGFAMWDSKWTDWNAARMGPKRDIVGELAIAIKKRNLKFVTAFHHAENWFFFPTWNKRYDCGDPRYSGLYGEIHEKDTKPSKAFSEMWRGKLIEVIDHYEPDFIWFDFGLDLINEEYIKDFLAYYYNKAAAQNKDVVVSYKDHDLPPGVGINDLELGQEREMTYHEWITDSTVDNGQGWGYVKGLGFKTQDNLIDNLADRVSKNGYLLLNIGPRPDGTIPDEARELLLGMGKWLKINGEAIYGTMPWIIAGEGPTQLKGKKSSFNEENDLMFTAADIRFTVKNNALYAIVLDWPGECALIKCLVKPNGSWMGMYASEIERITMLGDGKPLPWELTADGLKIQTPRTKPCDYAYVFKITRKKPF